MNFNSVSGVDLLTYLEIIKKERKIINLNSIKIIPFKNIHKKILNLFD